MKKITKYKNKTKFRRILKLIVKHLVLLFLIKKSIHSNIC